MKRVLLKIKYDGTAYHGWQYQPNAVTVQQVLQDAVEKTINYRADVTGCSRTDAGVHAREFYCHIDCPENLPDTAFIYGLNSILPDDISVSAVYSVRPDFHARYDALGKNYIYCMYVGISDPFLSRYALRLDKKPDVLLMNDFCKKIVGTHDFYGFSSSGRTVRDTVRNVTKCSVYEKDGLILFDITANGFLFNMVRILAGTALEVGYGKLSPLCAEEVFATKNRSLAGITLKPNGLFLNRVFYDEIG